MVQTSKVNATAGVSKAGLAGILMTLGIVFGDIGTSPLYVMKAITHTGEALTENYVLGALSCIIWTLTLQTTIKYVLIALRADNHGEGGILALYALLRRHKRRWIYAIAVIGASTLLADGVITPAITITTAIEGLRGINPDIPVLPVAIAVITVVFFVQRFGTEHVGRSFGTFMLLWFMLLGVVGLMWLIGCPQILKAFNPYYAARMLQKRRRIGRNEVFPFAKAKYQRAVLAQGNKLILPVRKYYCHCIGTHELCFRKAHGLHRVAIVIIIDKLNGDLAVRLGSEGIAFTNQKRL